MTVVVVYFCLVLARVGAFVAIVPLLGGQPWPRTVKIGLSLALTVLWGTASWENMPACAPMAASTGGAWLGLALGLGREVFLGAAVGFLFGLFLLPARVAGEFLSQEMGLTYGSLVGAGGAMSTPLTILFELVAAAVFLGMDGHHLFFSFMDGLFRSHPVGGSGLGFSLEGLIRGVTAGEEWGLMLAAPVALCLFACTIVLNLLGRAASQLSLQSVGFSLRLGVGLVALLWLMPNLISALVSVVQQAGLLPERVFSGG